VIVRRTAAGISNLIVMALLALAGLGMGEAHSRTLDEIKSRGTLAMCANPNALPYASDNPATPGFQIELARAIAQGLGVQLHVDWIFPTYRANLVNCDVLMDAFSDPAVHGGKLKLSRPYQKTGVALALAPGTPMVASFDELRRDQKIGVMVNSLASVVLGKKGVRTAPYAFEADMLDEVVAGRLGGCAISPATVAYYNHLHPEKQLGLVYAYEREPELGWTVSVGMRKADDALVGAVNEVLNRLLSDGTVTRIYAGYGVEHRLP